MDKLTIRILRKLGVKICYVCGKRLKTHSYWLGGIPARLVCKKCYDNKYK